MGLGRSEVRSSWHVPTGYEGTAVPTEPGIPPCGIEDADVALFKFMDNRVGFEVEADGATTKVHVIFAAGERFAMVKRREPIRDQAGTLILPLVSIRRVSLTQADINRGAVRNTGDIVVKRRLSDRDRNYQRLANYDGLGNQDSVASAANFNDTESTPSRTSVPGRVASRGHSSTSLTGDSPRMLNSKPPRAIYEVITVPFPQYFVAKYEVVIWTQYIQHMNQIIERLMVSYDDQGTAQANTVRLDTDKGYWFVAEFDNEITPDDNSNDFTGEERIIRNKLTVSVKGYIVAPVGPGMQSPYRRHLSAVSIEFESSAVSTEVSRDQDLPTVTSDVGKFELADVQPTGRSGRPMQRRGASDVRLLAFDVDPLTGERSTRYVSTPARNRRGGETVYRRAFVEDLGTDVI